MSGGKGIVNIKFNQDQDIDLVGSVGQCEMLYRTNILAVVSGGSRPKFSDNTLLLYDDAAKNHYRLIVALLTQIHVFSFPTPTQRLFSLETKENPRGICEVSPLTSAERQILVFPGHKLGSIEILDLFNTEIGISSSPVTIPAHRNDIGCIALNQQGTRIATASNKGTLIRVWDSVTKARLVELRRGSDPATVYWLSNLGILGNYGESQWALANFTVPPECACVCAFGSNNSVIAICLDGTFHKYVFNSDGNCNREAYDVFLDVCDDDEDYIH
ncbi:wd-repeat protein interacting with phosphoinosides wipi -related [Holotrichia oblita]|uniref:Wd-repeat protein interacting with phosphoinosides wipi -related n=1 Tax=Holotrichia oblita TaxID=644536 RepID=A0ACB9SYY4_HOLOL|nr:wd-repeat protein interacting with phosphoinosides wipi -related [Holotrichia oblita]